MNKQIPALLCACILLLSGCAQNDNVQYAKFEFHFYDVFDTFISLSGYGPEGVDPVIYEEAAYGELLRLHQLYDIYNDYEGVNNLKTVNDNAGVAPVQVDPAIIDLLQISLQAYEDTNGVVNIAMGPVLRLWHNSREGADPVTGEITLPDMAALRAAAGHTDIYLVEIDAEAGTVYLPDPEMALDVGAIAKGYAAQKAADKAQEAGLYSGILNAGGNVVVIGTPKDGRSHWSVGIQSPELDAAVAQDIFDVLYLQGPAAVVTSGDYQRYVVVDGKNYHHIIDPATLMPADQAKAVTVLCEDSTQADILSTAVFILPYEEGRALVEAAGAEAVWIFQDGTVVETEGYRAISKNNGAAK